MFGSSRQQRLGLGGREVAAVVGVAAVLLALQAALLVTLVGRPLERAVVAAREPAPARVLVRVPEYVEEIEVVGPQRWLRELARSEGAARRDPLSLADVQVDPASLTCPAAP